MELRSIEGRRRTREAFMGNRLPIVRLAANGLTDDAIALEMGLSRNTVLAHWKKIKQVLGARNRAHVVAAALAHGLVIMDDITLEEVT